MTPEEKQAILQTLGVLRGYAVEDDLKLKELVKSIKHEKLGRKQAEKLIRKMIETTNLMGEKLDRVEEQISLLFDEITKIKSLRRR